MSTELLRKYANIVAEAEQKALFEDLDSALTQIKSELPKRIRQGDSNAEQNFLKFVEVLQAFLSDPAAPKQDERVKLQSILNALGNPLNPNSDMAWVKLVDLYNTVGDRLVTFPGPDAKAKVAAASKAVGALRQNQTQLFDEFIENLRKNAVQTQKASVGAAATKLAGANSY